MKQYFYLQLKRLLHILPMLLIGTLITVLCVGLLLGGLKTADENSADKLRFQIAISGHTSGSYVQMGLAALQAFDDTRFSMDIVELPQEEAHRRLLQGELTAYVILPENFIERALYGDVDTVTFVTHAGGESIVSMFKNEVTSLITELVLHSQKGVYAIGEVAAQENVWDVRGEYMDNLAFSYIELLFARNKVCTVTQLGISTGLSLVEYYIGALCVFLLFFVGVAFITTGVCRDHSLHRLLQGKQFGPWKQILCEYAAHFGIFVGICAILSGAAQLAAPLLGSDTALPGFFSLFLRLVPVAALAAALNGLIFQLTGNVVSAVLWHFFLCLGQCYAAGCFYPVYALPPAMQSAAAWLPAGLAREFVSGSFLQESKTAALLGILLFTAAFWALTVLLRWYKLRTNRR